MNVSVGNITFKYNSHPVLDNISFKVDSGEILCIAGPNGSGKSTLLKCIIRILEPDSGRIQINGQDAFELNRRELAGRLAYLPQSSGCGFPATVFDAVLMGRRPHASWRKSESDVIKTIEALQSMDLMDYAKRDFETLSGGEQQRVMLARSIAQEAKTLILDEPTTDLDIRHQLSVMEKVKDLAVSRKLSVIMVVHDLNLASRYADSIILMASGAVYAAGPPCEVFTTQNIAAVYGVNARIWMENEKPFVLATGLA